MVSFLFACTSPACLVTTEREIDSIPGLYFDVIRTSCDTLAKVESITVRLAKTKSSRKIAVFKYDPDERGPLPSIKQEPGQAIEISIPSVSSIYFRADSWEGTQIQYHIGSVRYPNKAN